MRTDAHRKSVLVRHYTQPSCPPPPPWGLHCGPRHGPATSVWAKNQPTTTGDCRLTARCSARQVSVLLQGVQRTCGSAWAPALRARTSSRLYTQVKHGSYVVCAILGRHVDGRCAFQDAATGIRAYCRYTHCASVLRQFVCGAVGIHAWRVGWTPGAHGDLVPHRLPGGVSYRPGTPTPEVGNTGVWP